MSTTVTAGTTVSVAVEAEDVRVSRGLRELIATDPALSVTIGEPADVVVVELPPDAGPAVGVRICELARSSSVVVLGFDDRVQRAVAGLGNVTFVDKRDAGDDLLAAVHASAPDRPAESPTPTSWPRIAVVAAAAFLGPWAVWFSAIAQAHGVIGWRLPQGIALWSMVPIVVAAVAATSGRAGLRDLGARLLRFRIPSRTYAVAVGLPLGIAALTALIVSIGGGTVPYGELLTLPAALVYLVYGTGLFLLTEEAAWRGALLPRVQQRLGGGGAGLAIGLVWACWHLPLLATPGESDHGLPTAPFVVLIVATSVLMTALVNAAGGSVVVAALFHASFDACYSWFGVVGEHHEMLWTATALTTAAAAALLVATRGRLLQTPASSGRCLGTTVVPAGSR